MAHRRVALVGAALVLAAACLSAVGAEEVTSGVPVGGSMKAFTVQDVTGLAKGGRICYI